MDNYANYISIMVSLSTLAAAVISPLITAVINNRHQYKMKKLETYEAGRKEVIFGYIRAAEIIVSQTKMPYANTDYLKWRNLIYLYTDRRLHEQIQRIDKLIEEKSFELAAEEFKKLSIDLAKYEKC